NGRDDANINHVTPAHIVERNRRNAQHSTGPRTKRGKARARWNALTHGMLCREVVIPAGDGKEDRGEFLYLLRSLVFDLKPVGTLEEMVIEKIAVIYWKMHRQIRAEIGSIRTRLDGA